MDRGLHNLERDARESGPGADVHKGFASLHQVEARERIDIVFNGHLLRASDFREAGLYVLVEHMLSVPGQQVHLRS